jgi:hypothetical protein
VEGARTPDGVSRGEIGGGVRGAKAQRAGIDLGEPGKGLVDRNGCDTAREYQGGLGWGVAQGDFRGVAGSRSGLGSG